ncbi:RHS repeat-associated core domain-containing protein [Pseudomonas sp. 5P_5.1_Bac1]|uniref:RHS repeat-associated core domain-containing protein n=1 Tax=Pseudomonas sp. 5P_5.1_Bac1 TaxID=2971616 RepID=UPI0021C8AD5C|nr:RHS repeat-associated core domain-containing protein [Pseudomonas sp. 5P_5.1_Bac1]MCU1722685.1 hypothetical protein [Pseudomonas sp. 5P_5.1_Bac1]
MSDKKKGAAVIPSIPKGAGADPASGSSEQPLAGGGQEVPRSHVISINPETGRGVLKIPLGRLFADEGSKAGIDINLSWDLDNPVLKFFPPDKVFRVWVPESVTGAQCGISLRSCEGRPIKAKFKDEGIQVGTDFLLDASALCARLKVILACRAEGKSECVAVYYKNGVSEFYSYEFPDGDEGEGDFFTVFGVLLLSQYVLPSGRSLSFTWAHEGKHPTLVSIQDEKRCLLRAAWTTAHERPELESLTMFPDSEEKACYLFSREGEVLSIDVNGAGASAKQRYRLENDSEGRLATFTLENQVTLAPEKEGDEGGLETRCHVESLAYTDGKVRQHSIASGGGCAVRVEQYSYERGKTSVTCTLRAENTETAENNSVATRVYTFGDNFFSESSHSGGVVVTTEQTVQIDKVRGVAAVKTIKMQGGAIVDELTLEYDACGNLITHIQGDTVTEWTYYNNYQAYSVSERRETQQDTSFFGVILKPFEYLNPVGWGFALFGNGGLTWGTVLTSTVTMSASDNNYAQSAFQLPVEINYPGDVKNFAAHVESELVYRKKGDKKHALSLTYYGYEAFKPMPVPGGRTHAVVPKRKLTVLEPQYDEVDVSAEQLAVARKAAKAVLDLFARELKAATDNRLKEEQQASLDELNTSLQAQSKANARGFRLHTPWPQGAMQVEDLAYHNQAGKPGFGLLKSSATYLLGGDGKEIEGSRVTSAFDYSLAAEDARKVTVKTTVETTDVITLTTSQTRSVLSGRQLEQVDPLGAVTTFSYDERGLLSKETLTLDGKVLREVVHASSPLKGNLWRHERHDTETGQGIRTVVDELGRVREHWEQEGALWLLMNSYSYDSAGRSASRCEYDYDSQHQRHSTQLTTWAYTDSGTTITQVLKDASDQEIDRQSQRMEITADSETVISNGFEVQRRFEPDAGVLTETFGDASKAHFKIQSTVNDAGQLLSARYLKVAADKKETERDSLAIAYNWQGLAETMTPAFGAASTYRYDRFGRLLGTTTGGVEVGNTYADASRLPVATTGFVKEADDEVLLGSQTVDGLGRITSRTVNGFKTTVTYAGTSRWATGGDADKQPQADKHFTRTRDVTGLEFSETYDQGFGGYIHTSRTVLSRGGRLLTFEGLSGGVTHYQYDACGRVLGSTNDSCEARFVYADKGLLAKETIKALAEGVTMTVTYSYDEMGLEISRSFDCEGFAPHVIERTLLGDGRVQKSSLSINKKEQRSDQYEYDELKRLASWSCTGEGVDTGNDRRYVKQVFSYDAFGNVVSRQDDYYLIEHKQRPDTLETSTTTYRYDPLKPGVLLSVDGHGMQNDDRGRVTNRFCREITYHDNGQVKRYACEESPEEPMPRNGLNQDREQAFLYDDLGRVRGDGRDYYHYRGDRIYACTEQNLVNFNRDHSGRRMMVLQNDSPGCWMQEVRAASRVNPAQGLCFDTFELRDAAGTVFASFNLKLKTITYQAYTPYGERKSSRESFTWLGFKGEPQNALGLYHLGNGYRLYDPLLQRFQTPDDWSPFGEGGPAAYVFCNGDPVNYCDPQGHQRVAQFSRLETAPWMYSAEFNIATSVLGVLATPFTAGGSLALGIGLTGLAAITAAFDIASTLLKDSDPKLSKIFGYVGMATGAMEAGAGIVTAFGNAPGVIGKSTNRASASWMSAAGDGRRVDSLSLAHSARGGSHKSQTVIDGVAGLGMQSAEAGLRWLDWVPSARRARGIDNYLLRQFRAAIRELSDVPWLDLIAAQALDIDISKPLDYKGVSELLIKAHTRGFHYDRIVGSFCRGTIPPHGYWTGGAGTFRTKPGR